MKVIIEVPDIELFAKALNNAIVACGDIYYSIELGCEVPSKYERLDVLPREELKARYKCLLDVYSQIEQIEKENTYGKM